MGRTHHGDVCEPLAPDLPLQLPHHLQIAGRQGGGGKAAGSAWRQEGDWPTNSHQVPGACQPNDALPPCPGSPPHAQGVAAAHGDDKRVEPTLPPQLCRKAFAQRGAAVLSILLLGDLVGGMGDTAFDSPSTSQHGRTQSSTSTTAVPQHRGRMEQRARLPDVGTDEPLHEQVAHQAWICKGVMLGQGVLAC